MLRVRAMPSVISSTDISNGGLPDQELDWGVLASQRSMHRLASLLLSEVEPTLQVNSRYKELYVKEVLSCLASDKIWMIPRTDIQNWLITKMGVVTQ